MEQNVYDKVEHTSEKQPHPEMDMFEWIMKEANKESYLCCRKFSKLSFLFYIYGTKYIFKWSNESFNSFLGLLKDVLREVYELPFSFYETKKLIEALGFNYKKDHACPNDCILSRNNSLIRFLMNEIFVGLLHGKIIQKKFQARS